MDKYRIQLKDGRIIGPLALKDIIELIYRKKISGTEKVQIFPVGEWSSFNSYPELVKILESDIQSVDEETFIVNIKNLELTKSDILHPQSELKEFKFVHEDPLSDFVLETPVEESLQEINSEPPEVDDGLFELDTDEESKVDDNSNLTDQDLDKTQINPDYQKYLLEQKRLQEEKLKREEEKKRKEQEKQEVTQYDYQNEATQFMSIEEITPELEQAVDVEKELQQEEINRKKKIIKEKQKEEFEKQESEKIDENEAKRRKRFVILACAALLFVFFILPDDNEDDSKKLRPIKLVDPQIQFPVRIEPPDSKISTENYQKGLELFNEYKYTSMVKAGAFFKAAVENNFEDEKAMNRLIFTYSYLLPNSSSYIEDANTIFKLIQISKTKILKSPFFTSATTFFYLQVDKINAAITTIEKFKAIPGSQPSAELYAVYLKTLIKAGRFDEAKEIYLRLNKIENKNHFIYESIFEYHKILGQDAEKIALLKEAREKYPESVFFDLEAGLILADANKTKELASILFKTNRNNVEGSKIFYAKYLSLMGLFNALKNNIAAAVKNFEESLKLERSLDLIEKLSVLKESGNKNTDELITNSKAIKELRLAENAFSKNDISLAFKHALMASNLAPNLIEVKLFLAKLQLKKGYLEDAIKQLKKLYEKNPSSYQVVFQLIDAYIEAYKFNNATDLINAAVNIPGGQLHDFYSAKAKLSLFKGDTGAAIGWYQRAANANPIDDKNIFQLAKLFADAYRFLDAKSVLLKAIDLDPSNVKYKILYARILYEVDTSKAAIGYLYDVLKDFPDHPAVLSEIGIYYYRSGQIKQYKDVKERLLALPKKSASLYEFLIESARLDDDLEKKVENQVKLIEIEPGDLKTRMELASTYIEMEKYSKAKDQLEAVSERLQTYPKLNLNLARLYLLVDNFEKAKELAFKEAKDNPSVDETYVLLGDIFKKQENFSESNKYYVKALQINTKSTNAMKGLADIALKSEQFELALDQYQKVIEIEPDRAEIYKLLGDAYRKLGQSQLAIKFYQDYLSRKPNSKFKGKIQNYIRLMQ